MHGGQHHDGGLICEGEQICRRDETAVFREIDDDGTACLIAEVHNRLTIEFNRTDLDAESRLAFVVQCENGRCKFLIRKHFLDEFKALMIVFLKRRSHDVGGDGDRQRPTMFIGRWQAAYPDEMDAVAAEFFQSFEREFGEMGDVWEEEELHGGKLFGQTAAIRDSLQCAFRQESGWIHLP